jgi:hypothetical protein
VDPNLIAGLLGSLAATGLTQSQSEKYAAAAEQTDLTRRDIEQLDRNWPTELPAKWTAWDASKQRATWVERTWDANGNRIDKVGGLSGSPTNNPAVPIGNGLTPPSAFPVDIMLRQRGPATDGTTGDPLGIVWEFDWQCACAGTGSGSGSGSGGVAPAGILTACCPAAVPATLTATFHVTSGAYAAIDGHSTAITFDGSQWVGSGAFGSTTWLPQLLCGGSGWVGSCSPTNGDCAGIAFVATLDSCNPFQVTMTGTGTIGGSCPDGAGSTFNIVITE